MKKMIFILVILAVLLLSGCDEMLEFFYPDFAEEFNGNNVVDIEYDIGDYLHGHLDSSEQPLMMSIYHDGQGPFGGDTALATIYFYDRTGWGTFYIDDGNYDIWIWNDADDSKALSSGDFNTIIEIDVNFNGTDGYQYEYKDQNDFELQPIA